MSVRWRPPLFPCPCVVYAASPKLNEDPAAFLLVDERDGVLVLAAVPSHRTQMQAAMCRTLWHFTCIPFSFAYFSLLLAFILVQTGHLRPSGRSKQVTVFAGIAAEKPQSKALPALQLFAAAMEMWGPRCALLAPAGCISGRCVDIRHCRVTKYKTRL